MESKAIKKLHEKAGKLLKMATAFDNRVKSMQDWNEDGRTETKFTDEEIDTASRCSKRVWNAYLQVLTEIKNHIE
jgi:uncharacterized protein (UPF0332 family)